MRHLQVESLIHILSFQKLALCGVQVQYGIVSSESETSKLIESSQFCYSICTVPSGSSSPTLTILRLCGLQIVFHHLKHTVQAMQADSS